jgi:hypothetical protein
MHGEDCPALYQPLGLAGTSPGQPASKRWTIYGRPMPGVDGPDPPKNGIEVMPVGEHEALREVARAVVDEFGWSESMGFGKYVGALRAALNLDEERIA